MKLKPTDRQELAKMLDENEPEEGYKFWRQHYLDLRIGNDPSKRFLWDMLWRCKYASHWTTTVYIYANDDHITTALRAYFREKIK